MSEKSTVAGAGLATAVVGAPATLVLTARDLQAAPVVVGGDAGRIQAALSTDGCPSCPIVAVSVTDQNNGSYALSYVPTTAGPSHLSINITRSASPSGTQAYPLQGSPFAVQVSSLVSGPQSVVNGSVTAARAGAANVVAYVYLRDAQNQPLPTGTAR